VEVTESDKQSRLLKSDLNGSAHFKKFKHFLKYQHFLLLRDIVRSNL